MKSGDKLYRVWNAKLETATFVRESLAPGATVPTWEVRVSDDSRLHRVSSDFYHTSELEAWQEQITHYEASIVQIEEQIQREQEQRIQMRLQLDEMKKRVAGVVP